MKPCQEEVRPNVVSYSAALTACVCGVQWWRALSIFDLMQAELEPDLVSLNAAISACEKGSRWDQALRLPLGLQTKISLTLLPELRESPGDALGLGVFLGYRRGI